MPLYIRFTFTMAHRERNEAFNLHAIQVEKDEGASKSYKWTCKYCGKGYTSGVTRLF